MKSHFVTSNLETKQLEWVSYKNGELICYHGQPVTLTAVELSGFYRDKYSSDVQFFS